LLEGKTHCTTEAVDVVSRVTIVGWRIGGDRWISQGRVNKLIALSLIRSSSIGSCARIEGWILRWLTVPGGILVVEVHLATAK
jgi:hypothetical protein